VKPEELKRRADNLFAEVFRLGERVEIQSRYIDTVERRLREALGAAGLQSVVVEIADAIPSPAPGAGAAAAEPSIRDRHFPIVSDDLLVHDSWWPRRKAGARPLVPNAGWQNYTLHKRARKVVGVSACGLPRVLLETTLATIAAQQSRLRDFIPFFLTDSTDFDIFRRYGFVWEYFPGPAERERYAGSQSWAEYAALRRALLVRKWGLDQIIVIGPSEFGRPQQEAEERERSGAEAPAPAE
jgi:hypothetical protein